MKTPQADPASTHPTSSAALPTIRCVRIDEPIPPDGRLEHPAWSRAEAVHFHLRDGTEPAYQTRVKTLWDSANWYIGFDCVDPDPHGKMTQRDAPIWRDGNVVELFVDPIGRGESFYEFEINPLNTVIDLFYEQVNQPWPEAAKWNAAGLRTAVAIRCDPTTGAPIGWTALMAIAWSDFAAVTDRPPRAGERWRANFARYNTIRQTTGNWCELTIWSPTYTESFSILERFGWVAFVD